jgi:hypothetical protein
VFVWSSGEPERREVTKIGGLPHRSSAKALACRRIGEANDVPRPVLLLCFA